VKTRNVTHQVNAILAAASKKTAFHVTKAQSMTERAASFTSGQNTQVLENKTLEDICLRAIH
jgi:hypothetical protein